MKTLEKLLNNIRDYFTQSWVKEVTPPKAPVKTKKTVRVAKTKGE